MSNFATEPMVKHSNQVHTTTDYFLFKPIEGNRNKNLQHVNRLKKSMAENYLFTIIIVNEQYQIIDGQHRFDVIQELKLPLHYVVCKGYGLNEVHILNQNSKTWNADDYLEGYCNMGYPHYLQYAKFKDKYGFGHNECMTLLAKTVRSTGDLAKYFYSGAFEIGDYQKACAIGDKIEIVGQFYQGHKRRTFVHAINSLLKNPNFDFVEFIQKLRYQPSAMVDCTTVEQYVTLIEEIYNYRRREKVNLRFSGVVNPE